MRGTLAEFIVSQALGITLILPRIEWDVVDLVMDDGTTIEVKSSAYLQSWHQTEFSKISFGIGKTREWDPITNLFSVEAKRHADVYIFALLSEKDKDLVDPLNLDQWQFYVVSTSTLDIKMGNKKQITLNQLEKIAVPVSYQDLKKRLALI